MDKSGDNDIFGGDDGDVELSLVDREGRRPVESMQRRGVVKNLMACFSCEALCMVTLDFLFCWPRYICKGLDNLGCFPKGDCCDTCSIFSDCFAYCGCICKCKNCCPPSLRICNICAGLWHLLLAVTAFIALTVQSGTEAGDERLFRMQLTWELPVRNFTQADYNVTQLQNWLNATCDLSLQGREITYREVGEGNMSYIEAVTTTPSGLVTMPFANYTCPGQRDDESIFDVFDCMRKAADLSNVTDARMEQTRQIFDLATPTTKYSYHFDWDEDGTNDMYLIYLVILFSLITSCCHCSMATCCFTCYVADLNRFRQSFRWIEYSLTASLMMIVILQLSNVTDGFILGGCFILTMAYNMFGLAMEFAPVKEWSARVLFYIISTLLFGATFFVAFVFYYSAINPWFSLKDDGYTCAAYDELFLFVTVGIWTLLGTYLTFPILDIFKHTYLCCTERGCCGQERNTALVVHSEPDDDLNCIWRCCLKPHRQFRGVELHEKRRIDCYKSYEIGYIVLSFLSKTILVGVVASAALMRGN